MLNGERICYRIIALAKEKADPQKGADFFKLAVALHGNFYAAASLNIVNSVYTSIIWRGRIVRHFLQVTTTSPRPHPIRPFHDHLVFLRQEDSQTLPRVPILKLDVGWWWSWLVKFSQHRRPPNDHDQSQADHS